MRKHLLDKKLKEIIGILKIKTKIQALAVFVLLHLNLK